MKHIFLSIILSYFPLILSAQNLITGNVVDLEGNSPIDGVNVFVINTLNGTSTNLEGNFILKNIHQSKVELLISHVSYETKVINVDLSDTVRNFNLILKRRLIELDEVNISSTQDKNWKKYLKKFKKAFFGNTENADRCVILNPWVLEFENLKGNSFTANALAPLEIRNDALGYNILFVLEDFSVKDTQIQYAGKPFFRTIESKDQEKLEYWKSNRDLAYNGSKRHFLFSLAQDILKEEGFLIYNSKFNTKEKNFEIGNKVKPKTIYVDNKLHISDYLNVVYTKENESKKYLAENSNNVEFDFKGPKADLVPEGTINTEDSNDVGFQSSHLYLLKDKLELGKDGIIIESEKTIEYGYWSWEGIAELLPFEYLPNSVQITLAEKEKNTPRKNGFKLSNLRIDEMDIKDGGPGKDGIPALNYPKFVSQKDANFMNDSDKVIGLIQNDVAKAYPIKILNYHEVVNDSIGDINYAVTFCPLCRSGITFSSRVKNEKLTFGVSGLLYNSDVLIYDQETESLWSQIEMMSISGKYSGQELDVIATEQLSWKEWKTKYQETKVLSINTGFDRDYSKNPYAGYDETEKLMFELENKSKTYDNKELTLGIEVDGTFLAYPFSELEKSKQVFLQLINGKWFKIIYNKDQRSAMVKTESGELYPSVTLYWFAWYAFHPDTEIYAK